jgi:hypothetical protein
MTSSRLTRWLPVLVVACSASCGLPPDHRSEAPEPGGAISSEYAVDEAPTSAALVATCGGTSGQWKGCRGHGCAVCSETTSLYPYYFVNHPLCDRNLTCDAKFSQCNASCPVPTAADKEPAAGQCNGTAGSWAGCRGNGCAVCGEKLVAYPFYFANHPKCVRNDGCAGQFFICNADCPAPTATDTAPPAGTCNGTTGQWAGCRGNGCLVCDEKVVDYPNYFKNHPNCVRNPTCAGVFGTCNSNCPAPTSADRATVAPSCNGTAGQWAGCRGNGCAVCSETTQKYPYYFVNHPSCQKNLTCDGQAFTCNASCPAPTDDDKKPSAGQCGGTAGQWTGCRGNGCAVCSEPLKDYPFYFVNHANCVRNDSCGGQFFTCNASCPAPTNADKTPMAGTCNGTAGQWAGCRGNGCSVCSEKLGAYPNYFVNHPNCVKNTACPGVFAACNSNCPAPTDADRGTAPPDPFAAVKGASCPSSAELALAADDKWEVYSDGVRLKPTDATNLESSWTKPAKYALSLGAGHHVLAVHASDVNGSTSGLIANLKMLGLPYGGGLTDAHTRWKVLATGATPPASWMTAPTLAWGTPPVATDACQNSWAANTTFTAAWKSLTVDASPRAWVWNRACGATTSGWQKDNWYRFELDVRCTTGSTTCPEGTACPLRDATGAINDVGICKAGACTVMSCDDLSGSVDAAGKLSLPGSVADLVETVDPGQAVDTDVGPVDSTTDVPSGKSQCEPAIGDLPPDAIAQVVTAQNNVNLPMTELGIALSPAEVQTIVADLHDSTKPAYTKVVQVATPVTPVYQTGIVKVTQPTYVEPADGCDDQRNPQDPFAGRDIIFVHGYDPDPLFAKQLFGAKFTEASREWPKDKEDFYSGYYKDNANKYWHDHIDRYLAGKKNRYMTVAWSTNQRLDVAVDAMLTQVNDAMRNGRGVVATPGDLRGSNAFCVPNCIVVSHSTGGPLTDVSMAVAKANPSLSFIPAHVKTHVAFEGAFGGSPFAEIAVSLSSSLRAVTPTLSQSEDLCALTLRLLGTSGRCQILPDFAKTVTLDLVPAVAQVVWGPLVAQTPVPTLTVTGGHPTSLFPIVKQLFPGFDDDTLTSNSTCANPNPAALGPSGFVALNPFSLFDMGIPLRRSVFYYLDQKVDPWLWSTRSIPGYASGTCTPYLSPSGMMQPVDIPLGGPYDPRNRIPNHFSFLQSSSAHSIASLSTFDGRNYKESFGVSNFEESRVITDDSVYTQRGNDALSRAGTDPGVLISSAMKTMQTERVKGWSFTVSFRIPFTSKRIKKTFWLWKRRYQNLAGLHEKDQGDYVYQNVATTGPVFPAGKALCKPPMDTATGEAHSCALRRDGIVRCWGQNTYGQLGNGTKTDSTTPVTVSGVSDAVTVTSGDRFSCALKRDGTVSCWGWDSTGAINSNVAVSVGMTGAVTMTSGMLHTCALKLDGTVWCWGVNNYGQLGDGTHNNAGGPVRVAGLDHVVSIGAGTFHSCAVKNDGSLWCWGVSETGAMGDALYFQSPITKASKVVEVSDVVSVSGRNDGSCAVKKSGGAVCWGFNNVGQNGDGTDNYSGTPVAVTGLSAGVSTIASGDKTTCAIKTGGGILCWGRNLGQLGNGTTTPFATTPQAVSGLSTGVVSASVSPRGQHTCAATQDGSAWCWGDNAYGNLGNGTKISSASPVKVSGL